jgi:hypothetical protein
VEALQAALWVQEWMSRSRGKRRGAGFAIYFTKRLPDATFAQNWSMVRNDNPLVFLRVVRNLLSLR